MKCKQISCRRKKKKKKLKLGLARIKDWLTITCWFDFARQIVPISHGVSRRKEKRDASNKCTLTNILEIIPPNPLRLLKQTDLKVSNHVAGIVSDVRNGNYVSVLILQSTFQTEYLHISYLSEQSSLYIELIETNFVFLCFALFHCFNFDWTHFFFPFGFGIVTHLFAHIIVLPQAIPNSN